MSNRAQLNQIINLQIQGTRQVSNEIRGVTNAINNLTKSFNRSSQSQTKHQKQTKTSQQGLANIQAGLVQLSTWLLNTNVRINNLFDNMTKRFIESETAMTQLKITMGLAGESATDPMFRDRFREFGDFRNEIDRLAMSTEFTKKQVANAFTALVQSGRTGAEAMEMLNGTLQLATASGGQLDLGQAVDIATLTLGTLGGSVEEVNDNLNMLLKTSQKTKIGFRDLQQVLGSLRASYSKFAETSGVSREAELVALASATRAMGLSGAESAQKVDQFSRSLTGLIATTQTGELRKKHGKKVAGRFRINRAQLLEFFGIADMSREEIREQLGKPFSDLALAQDELVKKQFTNFNKQTGKYEAKSITELVNSLTRAYAKLYERKGGIESKAITQKALGTESAQFLLSALVKMGTDAGKKLGNVGEAFQELVATISKNNGELAKAQGEALKTLEKRIELVNSAEDALSNTIFQHDIYANAILDTYKETLTATNKLMKNNESLASSISFIGRMMQFLTGVGTTLGFTLTAMATFSIALRYSLDKTKGAVKGLGGTMRAFSTMFLTPTLTVLGQITTGVFILGLGIVALMRYFSGAEGIGEGFKIVLEKIGDVARSTGGIIQLAFSNLSDKKTVAQMLSHYYYLRDEKAKLDAKIMQNPYDSKAERVFSEQYDRQLREYNKILGIQGRKSLIKMELEGGERTITTIGRITDMIKNLARGFSIIGESAIQPIMLTLSTVFETLYWSVTQILSPVRYLAMLFGLASDEASFMNGVLKTIGTVLGVLISGYLLSGAFKIFLGSLRMIKNSLVMTRDRFIGLNTTAKEYMLNTHTLDQTGKRFIYTLNNEITILDRMKLKLYALTGQTKKHAEAVQSMSQKYTTSTTSLSSLNTQQIRNKNIMQASIGLIGALGLAFSMAGSAMEDDFLTSLGENMMMFSAFISVVPMVLNGIKSIGLALRSLAASSIISAGLFASAWFPVLAVLGGIAALYSIFSYFKPKPSVGLGEDSLPKQSGAIGLPKSAANFGGIYAGSSYINRGDSTYSNTMAGSSKGFVSSHTPANTVNNNNQQVYNIRTLNVNADNPQELSNAMEKQTRKSSLYDSMSGITRPT